MTAIDIAPTTAAPWRTEECTDEYADGCRCIVVTGQGDTVQYIADVETPELAAQIVADHHEVPHLHRELAETVRARDFHARSARHLAAKRDLVEAVIAEWESGALGPEQALRMVKSALAVGDTKTRADLNRVIA